MRGVPGSFLARVMLVVLLGATAALPAACADVRVDYTFMEDGSYRVEGQVVVTEVTQYTDQRLARLRDRLTQAGLVVTPLADPGSRGLTFTGDSARGDWAELTVRGAPRLRDEQGMVSRKSTFTWLLDWSALLDELFPEKLFQDEADALMAADFQVTVTFPQEGVDHNGYLVDGSGGRTVAWTVTPLESISMRADRSTPVWWRVVLGPVFVVGGLVFLILGRIRSSQGAPSPSTMPLVAEPTRPRAPTGAEPPDLPPDLPSGAQSDPLSAGVTCPVCDGPIQPGHPCGRCLAAVKAADGS